MKQMEKASGTMFFHLKHNYVVLYLLTFLMKIQKVCLINDDDESIQSSLISGTRWFKWAPH